MILTIDLESEQPIYIQIRNSIIGGIANGKLKDGESLPPVRSLAAQLGINLHTVNKAYNVLRLEGFVHILRKKGAVICAAGLKAKSADFIEASQATLKNIVSEAITRSVDRKQLIDIINNLYDEMGGNNL